MTNARMPAIFFGHGSPMNTLEDNSYTQAWRQIGKSLPRPKAILAISAHWYTQGVGVTAMEMPATIHDFGGFPQALFDFQYPAPGDPELAQRIASLLSPLDVQLDYNWGLDHGVWSVLAHLFPEADIPVVQLSMDATQSAQYHYDIGKRIAGLRDEGVMIIGFGNVVHNLRLMKRGADQSPFDWAVRFNDSVKAHLSPQDHQVLIEYETLDAQALLSVPTAEHYLPLLYVLGTQQKHDTISILLDGVDMGSMSMLSVYVGNSSDQLSMEMK